MWFRNELSSLAEVSLYYQDELMGEIYQAEISKWYDVDARANIKQQTWTVGPFHERSSVNCGHIFYFSFSKETEASYWTRGDLPWINLENLEEE